MTPVISPKEYAEAAALANAVSAEMLARLEWMTFQPKCIVDVGCGTGHATALLRKRYPEAIVVGVDLDYPMLQYADPQDKFICADTYALPFADHSVDFVFANLVLPWCHDAEAVLREWKRVLRHDGLLMFSTLGPDTLLAWREMLSEVMLPDLVDMHNQGDALTKARLVDTVMDVAYFTLVYRQADDFLRELVCSGMIKHAEGLKEKIEQQGAWEASFEIVYGHAWMSAEKPEQEADDEGVVKFPLSHLRRNRQS